MSKQVESEEEMIKKAIAESEALEAAQKKEDDERMLEAIRQSESLIQHEQERLRQMQLEEEK